MAGDEAKAVLTAVSSSDSDTRPHPATFRDEHLKVIRNLLRDQSVTTILDPFAGTGKIHELRDNGYLTYGIEREPEWVNYRADYTIVGDVLDPDGLPAVLKRAGWQVTFDAVVTSPCFGNRMADHHKAKDKSVRNTYRHKLGREISEGSSAIMQWGSEYRDFHAQAWGRVSEVTSCFVLNIKDHVRKGEVIPVTQWHISTCLDLGWQMVLWSQIETKGLGFGENHDARVPYESMILFVKPT